MNQVVKTLAWHYSFWSSCLWHRYSNPYIFSKTPCTAWSPQLSPWQEFPVFLFGLFNHDKNATHFFTKIALWRSVKCHMVQTGGKGNDGIFFSLVKSYQWLICGLEVCHSGEPSCVFSFYYFQIFVPNRIFLSSSMLTVKLSFTLWSKWMKFLCIVLM